MAPRRGGGSGGGGGGSSGIDDTPWGHKIELAGSHFTNPYTTARIVFHAIGIVGTLAILFWAASFRKSPELKKRIFRGWAFWLSIIALFVHFAIRFAVMIISEEETVVQQVFFLIITIITQSVYLAEISLLGVLYFLLPYCLSYERYHEKVRMRKVLKIVHLIVLLILSALFVTTMALRIKSQVSYVIGSPSDWRSEVRHSEQIDAAYTIIYFLASLEIVGWSVMAFLDARKDSQPAQKQLLLIAIIAGPLLLRSTYSMGATIYEELQEHSGRQSFYLAWDIIYNLTTLAIYGGIVAICKIIHSAHLGPDQMNPAAYDPNFWNQHQQPVLNKPGVPALANAAAAAAADDESDASVFASAVPVAAASAPVQYDAAAWVWWWSAGGGE
ncbi:MAG: hypothetical protein Q9222_007614 [Ikaeria aurantiellina]